MIPIRFGMVGWWSPGNIVGAVAFSAVLAPRLLLPLQILFGGRMLFIPPGVIGPINRGPVAIGRAALQPQAAGFVLPYADLVAVEIFAAMQTPPAMVQARPVAVMIAKQVELFVMGQDDVAAHTITCSAGFPMRQQFQQAAQHFVAVLTGERQSELRGEEAVIDSDVVTAPLQFAGEITLARGQFRSEEH